MSVLGLEGCKRALHLAGLEERELGEEDGPDFCHLSQQRPHCQSQFELAFCYLQPKESQKLLTPESLSLIHI